LYDVLTKGVKINFAQIGPIRTTRITERYNVSWDIANSRVQYQWLTTFSVMDESKYMLDLPIIGFVTCRFCTSAHYKYYARYLTCFVSLLMFLLVLLMLRAVPIRSTSGPPRR
jgi:hypothetical protein